MLYYMNALKRFAHMVWREPNALFMGSLIGTLLSLPLLTLGLSTAITVQYMYCREAGVATSFRAAARQVRPIWGRALMMGILDLAALLGCVSSLGILLAQGPLPVKFVYAVLLYLTVVYLSTALYRYPILVHNQGLSIVGAAEKALRATLANGGYVFLYWCTALLTLLVCAATGVGLVLLLPGAFALLSSVAWNETLHRFEHEEEKNAAAGRSA